MKKVENKYAVIGGQYAHYCHGTTRTLEGAKRMATAREEYWDNWQGWHKPDIYRIEDTYIFDGRDAYGNYGGRLPKDDAEPLCTWDRNAHRWTMAQA